ncbi:phosphatidylglycerophosphatase A [Phaeovibrio sulfidiphilus]|uniref:Phosphatidylglycerophosphatase A n=1 Tax=Phaeovibrio sulfidiphilus TaxID=1220600 RepID=A0A8J6YLE9_9PROT|nr:phosphatidylglycerophosphatase A [Phaeovibrio sulfidiphilus]MBE1236733.1 phosphatidylglycerophosphatase A [Phaeovibrio sulfidiphilus]
MRKTTRSAPGAPLPILALTTWFGAGASPVAPGTAGSLAALPCAALVVWLAGPVGLLIAAVVVTVVGIFAASAHVRHTGEDDPGRIVIDEVAGQWITLLAAPLNPVAYLTGFVLFRFFDILKPWPVRAIDRALKGGAGIMLDDVAAGLYALGCMVALSWLFPSYFAL